MTIGRDLALSLAVAAGLGTAGAALAGSPGNTVPLPKPRPVATPAPEAAAQPARLPRALAAITPIPAAKAALAYTRPDPELPLAPTEATSAADLALVKRAAEFVRRGKFSEASTVNDGIKDPLARKLVEWMILRGDPNHSPGYERYAAFVAQNPGWPSVGLLRRRAEAALWDDNRDAALVLRHFAETQPVSGKGQLAFARALLARGERAKAEPYVREAWQTDSLSAAMETAVLATFPDMLRPADHRARMHRRFYAEEVEAGLRAADRLGDADRAIARAWAAVVRNARNAKALLDAVPSSARQDTGHLFSRIRWLRRNGELAQATQLMLAAPRDPAIVLDTDAWWTERRVIARSLLEKGEAAAAYRVVAEAAAPARNNYRVEHEFMAGWIALRFLNDATTAARHFATITAITSHPTALARAGYWRGRAAEALGRMAEAQAHYADAARYRTSYYGQLAHARLGASEIALPARLKPAPERRMLLSRHELVRALDLLYRAGERDLAITFIAGVPDVVADAEAIAAVAEVARRNEDARGMVLIGRAAHARGVELHDYAFPRVGVPRYQPIGPEIDASLLYSIVRQESAFNARTVSSANAMGLMQVTPEAGRYVARKFGVKFDRRRLLDDMTYNVQLGAAELGALIQDYRGSYILAFAGYNAGRGRVRDWIARFGDPRDPTVDPVDWVEMIPFSETRNYVQRIMENVQVYRALFGQSQRLLIEADLRRGRAVD